MTTTQSPAEQEPRPVEYATRAERRRAERGHRMPLPGVPKRLRELDLLRFLAALSVLAFHFTARQSGAWGQMPVDVFPDVSEFTRYGFLGVQLFFVISGFVILMTAFGRKVGDFAIARITRLFPAYVFCVLLTATVVTLLPNLGYKVTPLQVLTNTTMLQSGLGQPDVDGVYWTLWVELRFYVLMALVIAFGVTYRSIVAFISVWLIATVTMRAIPHPYSGVELFVMSDWSPYFIVGMALYLIHRFGSNFLLWGLLFVAWILALNNAAQDAAGFQRAVGAPVSATVVSACISGIFLIMICMALGAFRWMSWKWLTWLGVLTYPLYLIHEWVGWVLIDRFRESLGVYPTLFLVSAIMILVAFAIAKFVEAPVSAAMRRGLTKSLADMRAASD